MPLLDHFRPPLSDARHWDGFYSQWASAIIDDLNCGHLPTVYFAEPIIHIGDRVAVDVAPPIADMTIPAIFPDSVEILVRSTEAGPTLVAAIELVSPGNKDREETRRAFCAKCASYVQQGVGLMVVDIVTSRQANLHNDFVRLLNKGDEFLLPDEPLYATSYRPVRRAQGDVIEVWYGPIAVGQALPLLPLALDKGMLIPLDLEAAYQEARERSRLL